MFNLDRSDTRRIAASAAGALLFSVLCIGTAVAPAQAAPAPMTMSAWQSHAEHRLDTAMAAIPPEAHRYARSDASIAAVIGSDGTLTDPRIVRSSGSRRTDLALLRKAGTLRLAPLPVDAVGSTASHTVILQIAVVDHAAPVRAAATPAIRYAAR